jgi:hypothetical protein
MDLKWLLDGGLSGLDEKDDYGAVRGYQKLKGVNEPMDTLTVSYNGHEAGRGNYYLERYYSGASPKVTWWQGEQISYDCHRQIAIYCPYLLGPESAQKEMADDPGLKNPCVIANLPTSEVQMPFKTAARGIGG